jgi:ERCC4-related helicase
MGLSRRDAPKQLGAFQAFQSANVSVLVSTATAEEGVDVSSVATVVSYDGLKQIKVRRVEIF